mgnify:CR=1 FL=1
MKKKKKIYIRPSIKSSKIRTIFFYGGNSLRSAADSEFLLAADQS